MSDRSRHKFRDVVPHPRYGSDVIPSGHVVDSETVRSSFWRYASETIFPESAIPADTSRQRFSVFPRPYYVDTLKECRKCGRPFLFFAIEQRHWYETLGFWIDADCVLCPACRVHDQRLRLRMRRYSERVMRSDLSDREFQTLLGDALFLTESGIIKDLNRLRRLRNLAQRRMPSSAVLAAVCRFLQAHQAPRVQP